MKTLFSSLVLICMSASVCAEALNTDANDSPNRNLTGFESLDEAQPLWEVGVGGGMIEVPNYPASKERNFVALAAPYAIYRGEIFRIGGDGGARAVFVENDRLELDMSFSGAFSADSDDDSVRQGMPELDYLFEAGPQLIYKMKDFSYVGGGQGRLTGRVQARAVFSTDLGDIHARGYVFEPTLRYQQRGVLFPETGLSLAFRMTWASEKLHDYFYEVAPEYETEIRSAYNGKGGYLGSEASVGLSFPVMRRVRGFLGASVQFNQGAANENSPLYEKDITYSIGVGFVWRAYQSDARSSW